MAQFSGSSFENTATGNWFANFLLAIAGFSILGAFAFSWYRTEVQQSDVVSILATDLSQSAQTAQVFSSFGQTVCASQTALLRDGDQLIGMPFTDNIDPLFKQTIANQAQARQVCDRLNEHITALDIHADQRGTSLSAVLQETEQLLAHLNVTTDTTSNPSRPLVITLLIHTNDNPTATNINESMAQATQLLENHHAVLLLLPLDNKLYRQMLEMPPHARIRISSPQSSTSIIDDMNWAFQVARNLK